jgi:hypothetical protein
VNDENECITTTEALVIDGANGVCRDVRRDAGEPLGFEVLPALGMLAVAVWALRSVRLAARRWLVMAAIVAGAALPGWNALLWVRADRPTTIYAHAARVAALHDAVRSHATEHGCAEVVHDECLACRPIALLALVDRRCAEPAPIELHADALESGCEASGARLVCGHPPRGALDGPALSRAR